MKTLLEKFGIPIPKNLEDYNLIGIDYGDGELTAACIQIDENQNMKVKGLALAANGTLYKNPNAFYISKSIQQMVYDISDNQLSGKDNGVRYYNFKKCPQDPSAKSKFIKDDGSYAGMTYEEIMVTCFSVLVNVLFKSNPYLLDKDKKTIMLVGRPSSVGWKNSEVEYAALLQKGLKLPANQAPVYVAVQAESTAALAREIDPQWDAQRVKRGETVVVLDNGSSTFDVTVITKKGVVGEDSYQFGGNQLDEILLSLLKKKLAEDCPGKSVAQMHGSKLDLRMIKEAYYGLKGSKQQPQLYTVDLLAEGKTGGSCTYEFKLDKNLMMKALNEMPVKTSHFMQALNGQQIKSQPVKHESWLMACRGIYQDFYDKMKQHFTTPGKDTRHPVIPDRIILSGGVSVMPEIQKIIEEVFGIMPVMTDRPNYSVSDGLAYVLGTEVRKQQTFEKLYATLDKVLPDADTLRQSIGDAGEEEEWQAFKGAMKEWADKKQDTSIQDLYDLWTNKYFNQSLNQSIQSGADLWYQKYMIEDKITDLLKKSFDELFPDYVDQFGWQLAPLDFSNLDGIQVGITFDYRFFLGTGEDPLDLTIPRDKAYRNKCAKHFEGLHDKVTKGGTVGIPMVVPVEKGLFFKRTEYVKQNVAFKYPGIRAMYLCDNGITPAFAGATRDSIIGLLQEPLTDYIESITPYFNMTARQNINN